MKKHYNLLLIILVLLSCKSQKVTQKSNYYINNNLHGYYKLATKSGFYDAFLFDGNGKVKIAPFYQEGNFFQKGDSVIVYPDKSLFVFKIKQDSLIGLGDWVENDKWVKVKDSIIPNNRTDEKVALKKANLLNQYHSVLEGKSPLLALMDEKIHVKYDSLCKEGLGLACMQMIGIRTTKSVGLKNLLGKRDTTKVYTPDAKLLDYAEKAYSLGEVEAYSALGAYYILINKPKEGKKYLKIASENGSVKASLALAELE